MSSTGDASEVVESSPIQITEAPIGSVQNNESFQDQPEGVDSPEGENEVLVSPGQHLDADGNVVRHTSVFPVVQRPHFQPPPPWYKQPKGEIAKGLLFDAVNLLGPVGWIPKYDRYKFRQDVLGALLVTIMIVPQALAYAQLAGLPPVYGLYASITPQIIYGIFGTTPVLGVGPVALVSIITSQLTEVETTEADKAGAATILSFTTGLITLVLSLFQAGIFTRLISHGVTSGFTSGAAILIMLSQFKHFFAIKVKSAHTLHEYIDHIITGFKSADINTLYIFLFGAFFTAYMILIKKVKKIPDTFPHGIIVVIVSILITYAASLDEHIKMPIVGSVPSGIPEPSAPKFSKFADTIQIGFVAAVVGFVESFAVARKFSMELGYPVSGTRELFSLGMVNFISAFFSGYPTTGSISRTAVAAAVKTASPLFAFMSGIGVLIVLVGLNRLDVFFYLPNCILSAIIVSACIKMVDYEKAISLWKTDKRDFLVWALTFLFVLFLGVEIGIILGVSCGMILGILKLSSPGAPELGLKYTEWNHATFRDAERHQQLTTFAAIALWRFDAPLFFFNADAFLTRFESIARSEHYTKLQCVVLDCAGITHVDSDGIHALHDMFKLAEKMKLKLLFSELRLVVKKILEHEGMWPEVMSDLNVFASTADALETAMELCQKKQQEEEAEPETTTTALDVVELDADGAVVARSTRVSRSNSMISKGSHAGRVAEAIAFEHAVQSEAETYRPPGSPLPVRRSSSLLRRRASEISPFVTEPDTPGQPISGAPYATTTEEAAEESKNK